MACSDNASCGNCRFFDQDGGAYDGSCVRDPHNTHRTECGRWCAYYEILTNEKDPTGKDAHESGSKLDAGKPRVRKGLLEQFPRACMAIATVSEFGANKYTWKGWVDVPNGVERYADAMQRHACKAIIEGELDSESGLPHAAHEAWNALAVLELKLIEKESESK